MVRFTEQENEEEEYWCDVFSEEILPRLPAEQLQTLKSVCKNWYRIISSPYFAQLQLNMYNESRMRVVIPWQNGRITEYNINTCVEETKPIPYMLKRHRASCPVILGSCDGLICLYLSGTPSSIAVYNPSTGKSFRPNSSLKDTTNYYVSCSWFGHHPCSGEYVLVLGNFDDEIGVYKFNNRGYSLEKIQSTYCCTRSRRAFLGCHEQGVGTLLHGALHWPVDKYWIDFGYGSRYVISVYRFEDNKCLEISLPVQGCHFKLGVVDGCLFAIFKTTDAEYELWIMKEYGVQQSWTKYANIHGFNSYNTIIPLGFFPNGDLMLDVGDLMLDVDECKLIKYSFNDNKHVLLMNHRLGVPIMCDDSLVSPPIVGT